MKSKTKIRLLIIGVSWYVILASWLGAWLYNNLITEEYRTAFWVSVLANGLSIYAVIMHYAIEGPDENDNKDEA